ncbi:MAG: tRNA (adenosine(37)-N6)-threonylcarbamoyltransferase complex ATPase subunit type 1 TsaE [Erysipelotrichaceae bacterium]|nr:tRNA (adenosine(37)-N6)-threonylcarbamoyltransferase complex ATPase subunit type 1 TsaE [Erysipelotrichaceae bacterium]MBR4122664.1 tRNA (adenosine(37)-N6)-threonylcarbamoyltransferase complex ATPase subunit type 1 TsaE [Erysipelotrichaceae bacterium]
MCKVITHSESETIKLGENLGKHAEKGMVFALKGDLAGGKTTITKGIGKGLGVKGIINSPTFTILKIYNGSAMDLYHIDAYRLENNDYDLGLDEDMENVLMVIEWPDYYAQLPKEHLEIEFTYIDDDTREISFTARGKKYEKLLEECGLC